MIEQQAYTSSIPGLSGPGRTAGGAPATKKEQTGQAAEADHFSALVKQGLSCNNGGEARTAGSMPGGSEATASAAEGTGDAANNAGQSHMSFLDFILGIIDVINPLQHIPVISTIYRHLTGDTISPAAQVAGDTLYGGPIGGAISLANVATKAETGHDIGDHMLAMVTGRKLDNPQKDGTPAPEVMLAQNTAVKPIQTGHMDGHIIWNTPPAPGLMQFADNADNNAASNADPGAIGGLPASPARGTLIAGRQGDNIPTLSDAQLAHLLARKGAPQTPSPRQKNFRSLASTHPHRTGLPEKELASSSSHTAPVPQVKNGFSTSAVLTAAQAAGRGDEFAAARPVGSTPVLQTQDAPAESARTAVPPGLIAARMMEALDKYAAMNHMGAGAAAYDNGLATAGMVPAAAN